LSIFLVLSFKVKVFWYWVSWFFLILFLFFILVPLLRLWVGLSWLRSFLGFFFLKKTLYLLRFIFQYWIVLKLSFVIFFYLSSIGLSYSYYLDCRVWLGYLIPFFSISSFYDWFVWNRTSYFFVVVSLSYSHGLTCIFDMLTSQVNVIFPFFSFVFIEWLESLLHRPFLFRWPLFVLQVPITLLFKLVH